MAITAFSLTAVAQVDLSAKFVTYEPGDIIDVSPMDGRFIITNGGADLVLGDSIFFAYLVDGVPQTLTLTTDYQDYYHVDVDGIPTGGEIILGSETLDWTALGFDVEFCCIVYGLGAASVDLAFPLDDDPSDNNSCIVFVESEEPASLKNEDLSIGDVYIDAGQLMIVNNGIGSDAQADVNIINMNGQVAQNESIALTSGTSMMEVSSLATGVYVVSIQVNGAVINRKISIQ